MLVIPDALNDRRFAENPTVAAPPHVRFYAGIPLVSTDDHALGTLCIIDVVPRTFDKEQCETLVHLARQAQTLLEYRRTISRLRFFEAAIANTPRARLLATGVRQRCLPARDRLRPYGGPRLFARFFRTRFRSRRNRRRAVARDGLRSGELVRTRGPNDALGLHRARRDRSPRGRSRPHTRLYGRGGQHDVDREIAQRKRAELSLQHAASHDELTGLPNRAYFLDRLQERLDLTRRTGRIDSAVVFLDLAGP